MAGTPLQQWRERWKQIEPKSSGGSRFSRSDRQQTGERVFDVIVDGLAHYGLLLDWLEDLRIVAGQDGQVIVSDMAHGAEAYLQVWARVH
jgi:hypothetical protein